VHGAWTNVGDPTGVSEKYFSAFAGTHYTADYKLQRKALTMYDGVSSTRVQTVTVDGATIAACANLPVNTIQRVQCAIPASAYATDRTITVGVTCGNCTGPRVNEIALEEKTRDVITPVVPPTPTPTFTPSPTLTLTPTATPTSTITTTISSFAAQWVGSAIQVTWSTLKEFKTDTFQIYRTTSLSSPAWALVKTQVSQSNCGTSTTPTSYTFNDTNVVSGQAYYYQLAWSGDACGGVHAVHPLIVSPVGAANEIFLPIISNSTGSQSKPDSAATPTLKPTPTPSSTQTPTPSRTATPTPILTPTPSYTLTPTRALAETSNYTATVTRVPIK